jgi:ppGpp synthetase/RelA/SpoT-type nucleotidyltranferase
VYSKNQVDRAGRLVRDLSVIEGEGERVTEAGERFIEAVTIIESWRALHARPLRRVNANLRYYVSKAGAGEHSVTQRLKRLPTIVDKLARHPNMQLTTMEDVGGVRAVLDSQEQADAIVADLRRQSRWSIRRIRDYVDGRDPGPKDDGYRAVHVIVEKDKRYIEIQLRTWQQDAWAQSVEKDMRRLAVGLKFGAGPDDLREYYRLVGEFFALRAQGKEPSEAFQLHLAQLYHATEHYYH